MNVWGLGVCFFMERPVYCQACAFLSHNQCRSRTDLFWIYLVYIWLVNIFCFLYNEMLFSSESFFYNLNIMVLFCRCFVACCWCVFLYFYSQRVKYFAPLIYSFHAYTNAVSSVADTGLAKYHCTNNCKVVYICYDCFVNYCWRCPSVCVHMCILQQQGCLCHINLGVSLV